MNDKAFEDKVTRDVDKTKKDLVTLGDDGVTGLHRMIDPRVEDVKKMVTKTAKTIDREVDHGLSQYNEKVQEIANQIPGDFGKKAIGYPWVTITMFLFVG